MLLEEEEDKTLYKVVVNHEKQYSIWSVDLENPVGWRDAGKIGMKSSCLAYIKEVRIDKYSFSLRKLLQLY